MLKYINEQKLTRLSDDFMMNVLTNQFNFREL